MAVEGSGLLYGAVLGYIYVRKSRVTSTRISTTAEREKRKSRVTSTRISTTAERRERVEKAMEIHSYYLTYRYAPRTKT